MRGISPIVATVLLIAIVVAIGALLYMGVSQMLESSPRENRVYIISLDVFKEPPPRGAVTSAFHYYVSVSTGMNWIGAFNYCKERGMFLAAPKSINENEKIKNIVRQHGWPAAWIGVYQQPGAPEPDGGWRYVTGDKVEVGFWNPGEPTNTSNEEHVVEAQPTGWNDRNGAVTLPFVCERIGVGFTLRNMSSNGTIYLEDLTINVYDRTDTLLASFKNNGQYIDVNIGGSVETLFINKLLCDKAAVKPGESLTCRFWAVPLKETSNTPRELKICLVGEGINVCDGVRV